MSQKPTITFLKAQSVVILRRLTQIKQRKIDLKNIKLSKFIGKNMNFLSVDIVRNVQREKLDRVGIYAMS